MKALNKSVSISSKTLETTDALCGYRAFSRKAYSKVRQIDNSMSGSAELLVQLSEQGMKFVDIPVDVRYDMEDTSTQGPVSLGMDILTGILQTISMKRPRLFFGVPGFISLIVGIILLYITLDTFAATASINPIVALLAIIFFIGGVAFCAISVLLFAISGAIGKEK